MNGIFRIYEKPLPSERTYIVLGLARGGTSMIASTLRSLGLFIGENIGDGNIEDVDFLDLWLNFDEGSIMEFARKRDAIHPVWGVKVPRMSSHLDTVGKAFRNPHYIVVTRDPLAVAGRKKESISPSDYFSIQTMYSKIFDFICSEKKPTMLVSYERAVESPEILCDSMAKFCGVSDQLLVDKALLNLREDRLAYKHRDYIDTRV